MTSNEMGEALDPDIASILQMGFHLQALAPLSPQDGEISLYSLEKDVGTGCAVGGREGG